MILQFYVVDDLLRGKLDISHFRRLPDAVQAYKALPADRRKALGVLYGDDAADLVRCVPLFPNDREGEDVLALKSLDFPLWNSEPQIMETAQELVSQLHLRCCLFQNCILPMPDKDKLPRALRNKYLWPDIPGDFRTAAQWIYVAGVGRVSPTEFKRRYECSGAFSYPLVVHISAFGMDKRGNYHSLQVTPWEFHLLIQRSKERTDQNKNEKRNLK